MRKRKLILLITMIMIMLFAGSLTAEAGWKNAGKGLRKYYVTSTKTYVTSSWYKIKKKWYYFDSKGIEKRGRFSLDNKYYYTTKSGRVSNKLVGSYYYGSNGVMITSTWKKIGKYTFYFGKDGKKKVGRFAIGDKYYYCDKKTGKVTSKWVNKHYYGKNGVMATDDWIGGTYVDEFGNIAGGNQNPKNPPSTQDIRLLAALTYYEAGNQSYYGKQCVASVVINRMNSKKFPNTLKGVINQAGQFTPALDGRVASLANSKRTIQAQCIKAAKDVLTNGSVLKGYYYFNNASGKKKIGDHYFS